MKRNVLAFALLLFSSIAAGEEPPIAVHSFADTSCGAWVGSSYSEAARAQYLAWFRGFVSGVNSADPHHQVGLDQMPNNETLALFVDKYCKDHPLNPFTSAAFELVRQLRTNGH